MAQRRSDTAAKSSSTTTINLPSPMKTMQRLKAIPFSHSTFTVDNSTQASCLEVMQANKVLAQQFLTASTADEYYQIVPSANDIFTHMNYSNQFSGWFDDTYYYAVLGLLVSTEFDCMLLMTSEGICLSVKEHTTLVLHLCRLYALLKLAQFIDAKSEYDHLVEELFPKIVEHNPSFDLTPYQKILKSMWSESVVNVVDIHVEKNTKIISNEQNLLLENAIKCVNEKKHEMASLYFAKLNTAEFDLENQRIVYFEFAIHAMQILILSKSEVSPEQSAYFYQNALGTLKHVIELHYDRADVQINFCQSIIDSCNEPNQKVTAIKSLQEVFSALSLLSITGLFYYSILPDLMLSHKLEEMIDESEGKNPDEKENTAGTTITPTCSTASTASSSALTNATTPTSSIISSSASTSSTSSVNILAHGMNQSDDPTVSEQLSKEKYKTKKANDNANKTKIKVASTKRLKQIQAESSRAYRKIVHKELHEKNIQQKFKKTREAALLQQQNIELLVRASKKNSILNIANDAVKKPHDEVNKSVNQAISEKKLRTQIHDNIIERSGGKIATHIPNDTAKDLPNDLAEGISIKKQCIKDAAHRPLFLPLQPAIAYIEKRPKKIIKNKEKIIAIITQTIPLSDLAYIYALHCALRKECFQLNLGGDFVAKLGILFFHPDDPNAQDLVVDHIKLSIQLHTDTLAANLLQLLKQFNFMQQSISASVADGDWQFTAITPYSRIKLKLSVNSSDSVRYEPNPLNEGQAEFDSAHCLAHCTLHIQSTQQKFTLGIKPNQNFIEACMNPIYAIALPSLPFNPRVNYCVNIVRAIECYGACKIVSNIPEILEHLKKSLCILFKQAEDSAYHFICSELYALYNDKMLHYEATKPFLQLFFFIALDHLTVSGVMRYEQKYFWSKHLAHCLQVYAREDLRLTNEEIMGNPWLAQNINAFQQQFFSMIELAIRHWNSVEEFDDLLNSCMERSAEKNYVRSVTLASSHANNPYYIFQAPQANGMHVPPDPTPVNSATPNGV